MLDLPVRAERFSAKVAGTIAWEGLGLSVKTSPSGMAISRVRPGSAAAEIGLEAGGPVLAVS